MFHIVLPWISSCFCFCFVLFVFCSWGREEQAVTSICLSEQVQQRLDPVNFYQFMLWLLFTFLNTFNKVLIQLTFTSSWNTMELLFQFMSLKKYLHRLNNLIHCVWSLWWKCICRSTDNDVKCTYIHLFLCIKNILSYLLTDLCMYVNELFKCFQFQYLMHDLSRT